MVFQLLQGFFPLFFLLIPSVNSSSCLQHCPTPPQVTASAKIEKTFDTQDNFASDQQLYTSPVSGKKLPYFVLFPTNQQKPLAGILIYMHGAGGGMEQGMSKALYKGNFAKLGKIVSTDLNYLYVTPSTTDFETSGARDLNALGMELQKKFPHLPIYVAGASAGGRTAVYALKDEKNIFAGALLLCPAINSDMLDNWGQQNSQKTFWVIQGDSDQAVSPSVTDALVLKLQKLGNTVHYQKIPGDHNAPVEQIDWKEALEFVKSS